MMKKMCCILLLGLAGASCATQATASENEEAAVRSASSQFYGALNQMFTGEVTEMKEVWSHADDVRYMGPGGDFEVGWAQVSKVWDTQAAMKLGGKVDAADIRVTVGQDIAVTQNFENGVNTNAKGQTATVSIRATNVFRKEEGKWKMIAHHTDLLPYLTK